MGKQFEVLNPVDVRNLVINELNKRDKIISKIQLKSIINQEIMRQLNKVYHEIDKMRERINQLELKGGYTR